MKNYLLKFNFTTNLPQLEDMTRQLIGIAERTKSDVAGGCDDAQGEFFVNASRRFGQADLLEMIAIVLPHTSNLMIESVAAPGAARRQTNRSLRAPSSAKRSRKSRQTQARPKSLIRQQ